MLLSQSPSHLDCVSWGPQSAIESIYWRIFHCWYLLIFVDLVSSRATDQFSSELWKYGNSENGIVIDYEVKFCSWIWAFGIHDIICMAMLMILWFFSCLQITLSDGRSRGYPAPRLRQWNWNGQGNLIFLDLINLFDDYHFNFFLVIWLS